MKCCILKDSSQLKEVLNFLVRNLGLPQIQNRLNIYSVDNNFQIQFLNNKVFYKDSSNGKFLIVKNKNLKTLFNFAQSRSKNGFRINDILLFNFDGAQVLFNTYHGTVVYLQEETMVDDLEKEGFNIEVYNKASDHELNTMAMSEIEFLYNEMGSLNPKIKSYAHKVGLDIRSASSSIRLRLSNLSNDYTYLEKNFKLIADQDLLSLKTNLVHENHFKNISIVIPAFNQNVIPTLLAIQGQNISKENKKKIQVIIVDDGSTISVNDSIKDIKDSLDYELNVITFDNNMGISNARNAGMSIAKYELVVFMDSDIILSKNYLYDINLRLQIIPNAIFVGMRKNVEPDSEYTQKDNLLKGIETSYDCDDSRMITQSKEYHIGWDKAFKGETISILDDTDYFKELSFGSKIGIYDLASVVTGHNMAINRSIINRYPLFSNKFKGWGMDDTYFASRVISDGCHVIPVLSSCVFHINHPPRSGSMSQKRLEASKNLEIYNKILDENWE